MRRGDDADDGRDGLSRVHVSDDVISLGVQWGGAVFSTCASFFGTR